MRLTNLSKMAWQHIRNDMMEELYLKTAIIRVSKVAHHFLVFLCVTFKFG